jgi:hypothetical protein
LAALASAVRFTLFLAAAAVTLSFYGRLALRLLKAGPRAMRWGEPAALCAGLAALVTLEFFCVFVLDVGCRFAFSVFFFGGALGAAWELRRFLAAGFSPASPGPGGEPCSRPAAGAAGAAGGAVSGGGRGSAAAGPLARSAQALEPLLALLAAGFVISLFYSAAWPEGRLTLWRNVNTDYNAWPLTADWLLGSLAGGGLEALPAFRWTTFDGPGVTAFLGLVSAARGGQALWSVPSFACILLSLVASGVWSLARLARPQGMAAAFLAAMGVMGGWFMNYLAFMGFFAQLLATFAFLAALREVADVRETGSWKAPGPASRLFFPVALLLAAYPGVFPVFFAFLLFAGFARGLLGLAGPGPGRRAVRGLKGAAGGAAPVAAAGLAACACWPGLAWFLLARAGETSTQSMGWSLGQLNAFLFSGLPFYGSAFNSPYGAWTCVPYLALAAVVLSLGVHALREAGKAGGEAACRARSAACLGLLHAASLAAYCAASLALGNRYQVWKFASFSALPLSFMVPVSCLLALDTWEARRQAASGGGPPAAAAKGGSGAEAEALFRAEAGGGFGAEAGAGLGAAPLARPEAGSGAAVKAGSGAATGGGAAPPFGGDSGAAAEPGSEAGSGPEAGLEFRETAGGAEAAAASEKGEAPFGREAAEESSRAGTRPAAAWYKSPARAALAAALALAAACFFVRPLAPLATFPQRAFGAESASSFMEAARKAVEDLPPGEGLAVEMADPSGYLAVLNLAAARKGAALRIIYPLRGWRARGRYRENLLTPPRLLWHRDLDEALRPARYVLTDRTWPGLVNGTPSEDGRPMLRVLDSRSYAGRGSVSFLGLAPHARDTLGRHVLARIRVPPGLAGREAELRASLAVAPESRARCGEGPVKVTVSGGGRAAAAEASAADLVVPLDPQATAGPLLTAVIELPEEYGGAAPEFSGGCSMVLASLELAARPEAR